MNSDWNKEKEQARIDREYRKLQRKLSLPVAAGQMMSSQNQLMAHIASVAVAIEAMETLLIAKGILRDDEVMDKVSELMKTKSEQVQAAQVTEPAQGNIILS